MDLLKLQHSIHKSPEAYYPEFERQLHHFEAQVELFQLKPASESVDRNFSSLVNFLTTVMHHYKKDADKLTTPLMELLEQHGAIFTADLRTQLVKCLIRLRGKRLISGHVLLPLAFKLFRVHDKALRSLLTSFIVGDIRKHRKDNALTKRMQNFMYTMLQDESEIAQKHSLMIVIALYSKGVWRDAKTVNVVASACLSSGKVLAPALRFFIDPNAPVGDDEEDARTKKPTKKTLHQRFSQHSKMTRGKKRRMLAAHKEEKREQKRNREVDEIDGDEPSFPALELLYDPQEFSEKLFQKLRKGTEKFEVRVLMMRLVAKVIKCHKLQLLQFYPFVQKYLQPHQPHVTVLLLSLIEACHELVPPEVLQPVVRHITRDFVTEYRSGPVIQLGLNSLREIAVRAPLALDQETVRDVSQFKGYQKDKGVVMAARSLINLYRIIHPAALNVKDRGKEGQMEREERVPLDFGEQVVVDAEDLEEQESGDSDFYSSDSEENPMKRARRDLELDDLAGYRSKMTKEEKLAVVLERKETREEHWRDRWEEKTSSTNSQKRRNKPFLLTKYSKVMRAKKNLSMEQKQRLAHIRHLRSRGKKFIKNPNV